MPVELRFVHSPYSLDGMTPIHVAINTNEMMEFESNEVEVVQGFGAALRLSAAPVPAISIPTFPASRSSPPLLLCDNYAPNSKSTREPSLASLGPSEFMMDASPAPVPHFTDGVRARNPGLSQPHHHIDHTDLAALIASMAVAAATASLSASSNENSQNAQQPNFMAPHNTSSSGFATNPFVRPSRLPHPNVNEKRKAEGVEGQAPLSQTWDCCCEVSQQQEYFNLQPFHEEEDHEDRASPVALTTTGASEVKKNLGTPCSHMSKWRRVRAKRGYSHFMCELCGNKWRKPKGAPQFPQ